MYSLVVEEADGFLSTEGRRTSGVTLSLHLKEGGAQTEPHHVYSFIARLKGEKVGKDEGSFFVLPGENKQTRKKKTYT